MMSIKFRNEDELAKAGYQIDPVSDEISAITTGHAWDMTAEEFASHAAGFDSVQCATVIREALDKVHQCFRRGMEWYYAAGRWLTWVKNNALYGTHGDWERWCRTECKLSPATAWKYMQFAARYTPQEAIKSFDGERFCLERALGYDSQETPSTPAPEPSTQSADNRPRSKRKHAPIQKEASTQEMAPPEPNRLQLAFLHPGHFQITLATSTFPLKREEVNNLHQQIEEAIREDDKCKPDALPE